MRRKKQYYRPYGGRRKPVWLLALLAAVLAALLSFAVLLGVVLSGAHDSITGEPKVMVILGCKVESWGPSILLQDRLDKALDYLEHHPDLTIVASGGQGPDEHQSEAQCMYDYLTDHGVDGNQILLEDQSHNTRENLQFAQEIAQEQGMGEEIAVVTQGFHMYRATQLAKAAGFTPYSLVAETEPLLFPEYYGRELLSLTKWQVEHLLLD